MNGTSPDHFFSPEFEAHVHERFLNCSSVEFNSSYFLDNCLEPTQAPASTSQPWWIHIVLQILYGIVCCVGILGNSLVIYVVVRFSKMQTVTNLYIVNLAIADECFLVGIPFLMTTYFLGYWPFGNILCKWYFTSTSINQITSSMFLLIMSADRYLAVCHPISAPKWRTPLIAKCVALTAWTLSALIMVPIYMYANTLEIEKKINCNIFWPSSETWTGESIFIVYSFIISFAIPLTLIVIFYAFVVLKLKTVGPKRRPPETPTPSIAIAGDRKHSAEPVPPPNILTPQQISRARDRKRSHRKVTKLVATVIIAYFTTWAPYWITQMILIFTPADRNHSETMTIFFLLAGCLSYSNSTMNPILYAFLSDNFKKSFLKACTCARGQDVNAQLHLENSVFPRGKKGARASKGAAVGGAATSGTGQQGNNNSNSAVLVSTTIPMTTNPGGGGLIAGAKSLLQVPSSMYAKGRLALDDDESGESEDDEGAAILGNGGGGKGMLAVPMNNCTPSTSTTTGGENTQNTFIQDGVHVTSL